MSKLMKSNYIKYKMPLLNINIIKWLPYSKTTIHNHNGQQCVFTPLNGALNEIIYKTHDLESRKIKYFYKNEISPFKIRKINDSIGYHQIFNLDNKVKWSLHRYY